MVHQKIQSHENSMDSSNDVLFREAEKVARDQKIMFYRWTLDRENPPQAGSSGLNESSVIRDADPDVSLLSRLVDRLVPVVLREKSDGPSR